MKKGIGAFAALVLALLLLCGVGMAQQADGQRVIVTSFYPMYVFAQNVARDIPGVTVKNMADQAVGCLHDYQLQTRDMVTLETADVFIINGGGMEQFMDKVIASYAGLSVIDASAGIEMLESAHSDHAHGHDEHDHAHGEDCVLNAHVWLNPVYAAKQVLNIADGLAAADPQNAQAYRDNAQAYCLTLDALHARISDLLAPLAGEKIITFHEAFIYFADAYGLTVAGLIENEAGEEPGTRELAKTCDLVREQGITALFVESQYPQKSAETIARETGAKVYQLDPVVSGDGAFDSYERAMLGNARVLTEALEP